MIHTLRLRYLAVLLFALNLCLTFTNYSSLPAGQTYDEIIYLSEARSLVKYGTDLSGQWRPWFLAPSDGWYAELTSATWVPGFILFPHNPALAVRFTSGLMGSALPVLVALLITRLYREKRLFLVAGLVLSFNPWIFEFSRMSFDSLPSVTLYTLGLLVLLSASGWKKLVSIPVLFWGFYQYQGHKPLLVPFVALAVVFLLAEAWNSNAKHDKSSVIKKSLNLVRKNLPALCVSVFAVVLTASYLVRLPTLTSSVRTENFSIFNEDAIASRVNESRRLSLETPFGIIVDNKLVEKSKILFTSFLASFEPATLFLHGDARADVYAVLDYGFLHWIDLPLIFIFFIFAFAQKKHRLGSFFMVSFVVLATLPNVLRSGDIWLTFRGAFVFISLSGLSGIGLYFLLQQLGLIKKIAVILLYCSALVFYLYLYFFRYPVQHARHESFYYRVLANYVQRAADQKVLIIPDRADATLDYLVVYNNLLSTLAQNVVSTAKITRETKELGSIHILPDCPNQWPSSYNPEVLVAIDYRREPCVPPTDQSHLELLSVVDSGTRFSLYNDKLCSGVQLPNYLSVKKNVFAVEELSTEEFCSSFFVRR
jgi:hypothetical protein